MEGLDDADLKGLRFLEADRVCRTSEDRVAFAHDLYGDRARLRILLKHRGDLPTFLRERCRSPLWQRATRLLGIHLLERFGNVKEWRGTLASLGAGDLGLVHDALLESPVFAVNAGLLLESILPELLASEGALLRRLLGRFLAFATVPDPKIVAIAKKAEVAESTARATFRMPIWQYWIEFIPFLHAHRSEFLPSTSSEIARVVEMWLEFAPKGKVRRPEAAELGVELGQLAIDGRKIYGEEDRQRFYKCAFAAANERPDDAVAIALSAAQRSTLPTRSSHDDETIDQENTSPFNRRSNPMPPWPDGPRSRIDDAFRAVVLDPRAIIELFRIRPEIAREVVLASLIKPPSNELRSDLFQRTELDIEKRRDWEPPIYWRGPFLPLLQINFSEGLELVVKLVDFATSRWREDADLYAGELREQKLAEGLPEAQVEELYQSYVPRVLAVGIGEKPREFIGDGSVYGWHVGMGNPPEAVESSLMALEQYFYQKIDQGKDVAADVEAVLNRARSVAFLGVLCDVGKKQPALFEGPLRSLFSAAELYGWDIAKSLPGHTHIMFGQNPQFVEMAQAFYGLEHRTIDLRRVAAWLMLNRPEMRDYFAKVLPIWKAAQAEGISTSSRRNSQMRQQIITLLDFSNYEILEDPNRGTVWRNVQALQQVQERADEQQVWEDQLLVMGFPVNCRSILDQKRTLSPEEYSNIWDRWRRIRDLADRGDGVLPNGEKRFGDEYANAILGGIAVLLRHRASVAEDASSMEELLSALRSILDNPFEQGRYPHDSKSDLTSECFAAESLAVLWAGEPSNAEWRRAIAEAALGRRSAAVKLLFTRCAELRRTLGEDFSRLRRLALEWAYVRERVQLLRAPREVFKERQEGSQKVRDALAAWSDEKVAAFVSGASPPMPRDWTECEDSKRLAHMDSALEPCPRPGWQGLDLHIVRCAHEWIPDPDEALNEVERAEWIGFWRSALDVIFKRHAKRGHDHGYPDEDEGWVLTRVAATVLQLREDEEPHMFWHPIIDLNGDDNDWPEFFGTSFHRCALSAEKTPGSYPRLLRRILERALSDVDGKIRWRGFERVWDVLMGIEGDLRNWWEPRHAPVVESLSDTYDLWMGRVPPCGSRLAKFASWLQCPAASSVRFRSLAWFLGKLQAEPGREIENADEVANAIARLLAVIWEQDQTRLRGDGAAYDAFEGLLGWLGRRQNPLGMELLERLGARH